MVYLGSPCLTDALDIRPGVGVLELFPHMSYQPWYALGEFVDNAIASYQEDYERLRKAEGDDYRLKVHIGYHREVPARIEIRDNAGGIPTRHYARAFQTARLPEERGDNALRQFGVGMKSAVCWFAKQWSVRTTALGEDVERTVTFNVPEIVAAGTESLDPVEEPVAPETHYTVLELTALNREPQGRTLGKIKSHLASMYRGFTSTGELELIFDGERLVYEPPDILESPPHDEPEAEPRTWQIPIDFKTEDGVIASGFAAIRAKGSTREAGFALFKDRRLIVGSDDDTYRPEEIFGSSNSFRYQRIFGELQLSGVPLTHSKDAFQWDDREDVFISALEESLRAGERDLLTQAENHRARRAEHETIEAAQAAVERTASELEEAAGAILERHLAEDVEAAADEPDGDHTDDVADYRRDFTISFAEQVWNVQLTVDNDPAVRDWIRLSDTSWKDPSLRPREVRIDLNLAHPFLRRFGSARGAEFEVVVRLGAALMLAEVTIRQGALAHAQGMSLLRRRTNEILETFAREEASR